MNDNNKPQGPENGGGNPWMKSLPDLGGYSRSAGAVRHHVRSPERPDRGRRDVLFELPRQGAGRRGQDRSTSPQARRAPASSPARYPATRKFRTNAPNDPQLISTLRDKGVTINARPEEQRVDLALYPRISRCPSSSSSASPSSCCARCRRVGGAGGAMGFGKSKAQAAHREAGPRHLRRRRRHRRGARGAAGDRRVPEGSDQVRAPRRQDPQGRAAGRLARHRQDAARPRDRG